MKGAGDMLPSFRDYERTMRYRWLRSLKKSDKKPKEPTKPDPDGQPATAIGKIFHDLEGNGVVGKLDSALTADDEREGQKGEANSEESAESRGLRWLNQPSNLLNLLHPKEKDPWPCKEIRLRADDLRVSPFFTEMGVAEPPEHE